MSNKLCGGDSTKSCFLRNQDFVESPPLRFTSLFRIIYTWEYVKIDTKTDSILVSFLYYPEFLSPVATPLIVI